MIMLAPEMLVEQPADPKPSKRKKYAKKERTPDTRVTYADLISYSILHITDRITKTETRAEQAREFGAELAEAELLQEAASLTDKLTVLRQMYRFETGADYDS